MKHLIVLFAAPALAAAADLGNLKFGGYLENATSVQFSEDESISDVASLRFEGNWEHGAKAAIETHVILTAALRPLDPMQNLRPGSPMARSLAQMLARFAFLDTALQQAVGGAVADMDTSTQAALGGLLAGMSSTDLTALLRYLPYTSFYPKNTLTLDRALLKLYFKPFDLFVGRQIVAWGTGYAFNPTDIWNAKNPMDPKAAKVGVNALRMEIPLGELSGLSLVLSPGPDFDLTSGGLRVKTNIGGFDLSLSGSRITNADRAILGLPERIVVGADLAGQIGDVGVWFEGAVSDPLYDNLDYADLDSVYFQGDWGLDYTFENGLMVMLEYYLNGLGQKEKGDYGVRELTHLLAGQMPGLGRHYAMLGVTKGLGDSFMLQIFGLTNFTDLSAMLLPTIEYTFSDNMIAQLGAQIGVGNKKESEYGGVYPGVTLTVTGYF